MIKLASLALKKKIILASAATAVTAATVTTVVVVNNQKEDAYRVVKVFETQGDYNTAKRFSRKT